MIVQPANASISRHVRCAAAMVWLLVVAAGCARPEAEPTEHAGAVKPTGKTVTLVIDFDDGLEKHYLIAWREGMTVLDVLEAAARRPRGIALDRKGSGAAAMITAIDGVQNGTSGKDWIYRVGGQLADKSCGAYPTAAGDVILWKFGKYE